MLKWVLRIALGLVALAVLGLAGVYAASEVVIRRQYDAPLPVISISTDPAAIARGERLGWIHGCSGCHQPTLHGEKWEDNLLLGRLYPSNLTRVLSDYSDAELARAIRQGIRNDGSTLWEMPSATFATLTDQDTADIIAWMRTHEASGPPTPKPAFGPLGRLAILMGELKPQPDHVAAAALRPPFDAGPEFAAGRYLAQTVCTDCHGSDLSGVENDDEAAPNLTIAGGYDLAEFSRFMRTGIASDGKEKGFMSETAKKEFVHFTDQEIAALHAYLVARAERAPPPAS